MSNYDERPWLARYTPGQPGRTTTPEELMAHCKQKLPACKYPRQVGAIGELPRAVTGKILRRELRGR